jgi:peptidoglycan-associated lipoprotein
MKLNAFLLVLSLFSFLSCGTAQPASVPAPGPAPAPAFVSWDKKMIDLGRIKKGEKRSMFFEFTNTAGKDIQIDIVDACECTKVDFPRGIIAPGAKGRIDAVFNSEEKDAPETIDIRVMFTDTDARGYPRIEVIQYKFDLEK